MSKKNEKETPVEKLEEGAIEVISRSEEYLYNNRKKLAGAILLVVLVIGGLVAYHYLYSKPREAKAAEAMHKAEYYFILDSAQLALNGNGSDVQGFLSIIKEYGSTEAGNLAHAYAGRCFYQLGDYQQAIEHLKKYKSDDTMVAPSTIGLIGDCHVALGDYNAAVKSFEEAAKMANNEVLSPIFLKKAGIAYEKLGNKEKALQSYEEIKSKYYNSPEASEIDKMIQALSYK